MEMLSMQRTLTGMFCTDPNRHSSPSGLGVRGLKTVWVCPPRARHHTAFLTLSPRQSCCRLTLAIAL